MEHDRDLQNLIRRWNPPPPGAQFDERMMARYAQGHGPFWKRRVEFRFSLPAPVLALTVVVVLAGSWFIWRPVSEERIPGLRPVDAPQFTVTRAGAGQ